jgi:hypothetical protein
MSFQVTAKNETDTVTYVAIGDRDVIMDAAYDSGALAVSIQVLP